MNPALQDLITQVGDDTIEKEYIIQALSTAVKEWMNFRLEELFSKLYRLDILELDIKEALKQEDIAHAIATLIYNRQIQKIEARKNNPPEEAPEDLKW